ncbi:MAG: hypothetical protein M3O22_05560 [Pseudomonadota bacterium]|nr:hypothetical protein [Pseudomonadota bacterium]
MLASGILVIGDWCLVELDTDSGFDEADRVYFPRIQTEGMEGAVPALQTRFLMLGFQTLMSADLFLSAPDPYIGEDRLWFSCHFMGRISSQRMWGKQGDINILTRLALCDTLFTPVIINNPLPAETRWQLVKASRLLPVLDEPDLQAAREEFPGLFSLPRP